jgi:ABC-2 type transport system permease protein
VKNLYFFTKKEIVESWRTYRSAIVILSFLIFGLMNPLLAKLTPEIVKLTVGEAMAKTIPEPTSLDSWTQFFKNVNQIGLIVVALIFSGTVSNEVSKGTLINLVTKGLRRGAIIGGKIVNLLFQWSISFLVAFLVTWGYTNYYFDDSKSSHLFQAVFPVWLFGVFLMSLILFSSTIARNSYEGLLVTGGAVVLLLLLSLFHNLKKYNPISLVTQNLLFLQQGQAFEKYVPAMVLAFLLSLIFLLLSTLVLNKKKL